MKTEISFCRIGSRSPPIKTSGPTRSSRRNLKIKSSNTSGYPGVRLVPSGNFAARIVVNRKEIFLGTYDSIEEAIEARVRAEKKYFGEFSPTLSRNREYHSCNPRIELEVTEVGP